MAKTLVLGNFTGIGNSPAAQASGGLNVVAWGTFVATLVLERSFDGGTVYVPVLNQDGFTSTELTMPGSLWRFEFEAGVLYRWRCSAFTSGTVKYRLSA